MKSKDNQSTPPPPADGRDGLRMEPELMLELARRAAELVVQRIENLPDDTAWEGEFKQGLEDQLMQDPPEEGRPAEEVLEWAARDILPIATRLDHPRCFGFVPTSPTWPGVLADFMAAGYNANTCTWLVASGPSQIELVVIDWLRRWIGYPDSTGAIDPLGAMADYCAAEGIWLHVDGAYGGFAAVTERGKRLLAGIERADSVGMDAHKWFFQPYEAGCLLVKDVGADLRDGRVPAGRVAGHGAGSPRGGTHPEEPPAGAAEPRVTGDRVLSDQSRRRRSRRAGPGRYQPDRARPRLLGRPRIHVFDAAPQDVFPPALHRQPHHDVG